MYKAHCAVIFAIAQLSCCFLRSLYLSRVPEFIYETKVITSEYVVAQWLLIDIETDDIE